MGVVVVTTATSADLDYGYLLIAATRYQLSRATYGVLPLHDAIVAMAPTLMPCDRALLDREITEALNAGDVKLSDTGLWQRALSALRAVDGR